MRTNQRSEPISNSTICTLNHLCHRLLRLKVQLNYSWPVAVQAEMLMKSVDDVDKLDFAQLIKKAEANIPEKFLEAGGERTTPATEPKNKATV